MAETSEFLIVRASANWIYRIKLSPVEFVGWLHYRSPVGAVQYSCFGYSLRDVLIKLDRESFLEQQHMCLLQRRGW